MGMARDLDTQLSLATVQAAVLGESRPKIAIGRFEVLRRLGRGKTGVVFEARDMHSGEQVALKTLRPIPEIDQQQLVEEFRVAAEIHHRNLVRLYELGSGDQPFIVMELVEGLDFARVLSGLAEQHRWETIQSHLDQLTHGLAALHQRGFVHCDIKPDNVVVTDSGRVVILDFGFSRGATQGSLRPMGGTMPFLAPERRTHPNAPVHRSSDIYAMGMMTALALGLRTPNIERPPNASVRQIPHKLRARIESMLEHNPAHRPSCAELLTDQPAGDALGLPFVGRRSELDHLTATARAREGGRFVVLKGDSGSGKSALMLHFAAALKARGWCVLKGRCHEREAVPFGGIDQIVEHLAQEVSAQGLSPAQLGGVEAWGTLAATFPVLSGPPYTKQSPQDQAATEVVNEHDHVGSALKRIIRALGQRQPVLLCIDDLQWLEGDGAAVLQRLTGPPPRPSIVIIATIRPEIAKRRSVLQPLHTQLCDTSDSQFIELGGLSDPDAARLVRHVTHGIEPSRVRRILSEARGNPFFLIELARASRESGSSVHALVERRIARLDPPARRMAELVALAGGPIELSTAITAAQVDHEARAVVHALRAANLIRSDDAAEDGQIDCDHARVRVALLASVVQRPALHRRLALAYITKQPNAWDDIAWHAHQGELGTMALRYARKAAERSMAGRAFERAARALEIALTRARSHSETRVFSVLRAKALSAALRHESAGRAYDAAAKMHGGVDQAELRVAAASQYFACGALDLAETALTGLVPEFVFGSPTKKLHTVAKLIRFRLWLRLRGLRRPLHPEHTVPKQRLVELDACWQVALLARTMNPHLGLAINCYYVRRCLELGEPKRLALALSLEAANFVGRRAKPGAAFDEVSHRAHELARATGDTYTLGSVEVHLAITRMFQDAWPDAIALAESGERRLRASSGTALELYFAQMTMLNSLRLMGDFRRYMALADRMLEEVLAGDNRKARASARAWTHLCFLLRDDPEEAMAQTEAIMSELSSEVYTEHETAWVVAKGRVLLYIGRYAEAWEHLKAGCQRLRRSGWWSLHVVRVELVAQRARAAACMLARTGERTFERSAHRDANRLSALRHAGTFGIAQSIRASLAAHRGDMARARELLRAAIADFHRCGMQFELMAARLALRNCEADHRERAALEAQVETYANAHGLVDPARLAHLVVPAPLTGSQFK